MKKHLSFLNKRIILRLVSIAILVTLILVVEELYVKDNQALQEQLLRAA